VSLAAVRSHSKMFDTPPTNSEANNYYSATCPSPPRPNQNFVPVASSAAALQLAIHEPRSITLPRRISLPRRASLLPPPLSRVTSTSTFTSLASDSPQSLTLTFDDVIAASSSELSGFILAAPSASRRLSSSNYPVFRGNNNAAAAPQDPRSPIIKLQPRRSAC
jgi:hypothetical protein